MADLGIDGKGAPPEMRALHRTGGLQGAGAGAEPHLGVWGRNPPEAEA